MKIFLILFIFSTWSAWSKPFQIVNREYGPLTPALITQVDSLLDELEDDVNSELPDADQKTYLRGMGNANVMSGKGSSDYANDVKIFLLKYGVGVGADLGNNSTSDILNGTIKAKQFRGASFQLGFTFGLSLRFLPFKSIGPIETKKADIFMHIGSMDSTSEDNSFTINSKSFGLYFRYKVHPGKKILPFGGLDWQGVYLTTGIETHDMLLKLKVDVSLTESVQGLGTATLAGSVTAGVDVETTSIPIELSTNFQWLYFFTTYLGLGMDINSGTATSLAESNVSLSTTISDVGGVGQIDLGTSDKPSPLWMRWFIGQQFNFWVLKANVQFDHVPGKGYWGVNAGLAITY